MPNQYTKAKDKGTEKPKGANQFTTGKREGHDEATKDRMRAAKSAELLEQEVDGTIELKDGRRAAAKILMEFGKPKFTSIEQINLSETDKMSEEELLGMATALISSHPELIAQLNLAPKPVQVDAETGIQPLSEVSKTA